MVNEVFYLISLLKDINKVDLIITEDEEYIMKAFHKKLKGIIPYTLWRKIVMNFSIETLNDIYNSCDILVDEIYKKYKK